PTLRLPITQCSRPGWSSRSRPFRTDNSGTRVRRCCGYPASSASGSRSTPCLTAPYSKPTAPRKMETTNMMPETNEGQRLQYAIQAAMRAIQARGGETSSYEWGPGGEDQLDQVHNRLKDAIRDRVAQRVQEKLAEVARE